MKNFKRLNYLLLFTIFVLGSCDKDEEISIDQQRIETLAAGAWTMTSTTVDGVERDLGGTLTSHTQTHGYCILADSDCSGSNAFVLELDNNGGILTGGSTFTYKIHENGTMMTINVINSTFNGVTSPCSSDCETVFTFSEWSNTKHVLETTDGTSAVVVRTMERL